MVVFQVGLWDSTYLENVFQTQTPSNTSVYALLFLLLSVWLMKKGKVTMGLVLKVLRCLDSQWYSFVGSYKSSRERDPGDGFFAWARIPSYIGTLCIGLTFS